MEGAKTNDDEGDKQQRAAAKGEDPPAERRLIGEILKSGVRGPPGERGSDGEGDGDQQQKLL